MLQFSREVFVGIFTGFLLKNPEKNFFLPFFSPKKYCNLHEQKMVTKIFFRDFSAKNLWRSHRKLYAKTLTYYHSCCKKNQPKKIPHFCNIHLKKIAIHLKFQLWGYQTTWKSFQKYFSFIFLGLEDNSTSENV
jgi:hypothetical protein